MAVDPFKKQLPHRFHKNLRRTIIFKNPVDEPLSSRAIFSENYQSLRSWLLSGQKNAVHHKNIRRAIKKLKLSF
jgi:hypothetical protein